MGIIKSHFGDLSIQRGRKLVFMGIYITFHPDSFVSIGMVKYLSYKIYVFPEEISGPVPLSD